MKASNKAIVKIHRDMYAITQASLAKQTDRLKTDPYYKFIGIVRVESKKWERGEDGVPRKVLIMQDGSVYLLDKTDSVALRDSTGWGVS